MKVLYFFHIFIAFAFLILGFGVHPAHATQDVSSPVVNEGAAAVEVRGGWRQDNGNDEFRLREHIDYGFNDAFALRLIANQKYDDSNDGHYTATGLEARWQLFERDEHGWAGGIRTTFEKADNATSGADELGLRFLGLWQSGKMQYRLNLDFNHEIGPRAEPGILFGTRAQAIYRLQPEIKAGLEIFSDYDIYEARSGWDAHRHQLGPVAKLEVTENMDVQLGYLVGITPDSPDSEVKLFVSWGW